GARRRSLLRLLLWGIAALRLIIPRGVVLLARLSLRLRAGSAAAAEQAGEKTAAALLAGAILLQLGDLAFQLFDPLVQLFQRRFLNNDRLRHIVRRGGLFAQVLLDLLFCPSIPLSRLGFG